MEATDEPFTMSYELMLHSSDAVHSLLGSAQHHNSSAPEPIITDEQEYVDEPGTDAFAMAHDLRAATKSLPSTI